MKNETQFIKRYFSLSYFGNTLANTMLNSCFVLFFTSYKGFSASQISLILGLSPIIALPTFFIWGAIIDKTKKLIFFSRIVSAGNIITLLAFFFVDSFTGVFILSVIRSIIMQPNSTLNEEYILVLSKRPNVIYGKIRVCSTIGYGVSGILVPIILTMVDIPKGFLSGIFMVFLSLAILMFVPEITTASGNDSLTKVRNINVSKGTDNEIAVSENDFSEEKKHSFGTVIELLKNKEFIRYLVIYSAIWGTIAAASNYGSQVIMIDLGASKRLVTMMPLFLVSFEILILFFGHKYIKIKNSYTILTIALVILSLRWILIANTSSYIIILILTLIHGMTTGLVIPIHNGLIGKMIPKHQVSTAFLTAGILAATILPGLLNIICGYAIKIFGISFFGYFYLLLTIIALILVIPKTIEERINLKTNISN